MAFLYLASGRKEQNKTQHVIQVTSVQLLEFGYLIVIGREDGHVITMKLMDPAVIGYDVPTDATISDRQNWVS